MSDLNENLQMLFKIKVIMCNKLHVHTDFSKEESFNRQKTFYVKLMPTISPLNLIHIYQVHAIPNNNPTLQ